MFDFNGDGVVNLSDLVVLLTAVILVATVVGGVWRFWIRPSVNRIHRFMEQMEAMAALVTTEFNTNGGSTIKDAVKLTLHRQEESMVWQREHAEWANAQYQRLSEVERRLDEIGK